MNIADNLIFDDERVFRRLRVYDPSITKLVSECADAMRANSIINSSVEILQKVANDAARRETQDLTREDYGNTLSDYTRTIEEDKMHDPLVRINSALTGIDLILETPEKHHIVYRGLSGQLWNKKETLQTFCNQRSPEIR